MAQEQGHGQLKPTTSIVRYPTVVDRSYKRFILPSSPDVCYLRHPSGGIVVTLSARRLSLLPEGVTITKVNWNTNPKKKGVDRSKLKVVGKSKKGALRLVPDTRLCIVEFSDGSDLTLRAGIMGLLLEANARLADFPDLARTEREGKGFLCIVMPPPGSDRRYRPKEFTEDTLVLT